MQIFVNRTSQRHCHYEQQDDDNPEEAAETRGATLPQEVKHPSNDF